MKVQRLISIDIYIHQALIKEDNASALINGLLIKHYDKNKKSSEEIINDVKEIFKKEEDEVKNKEKMDILLTKRIKEMTDKKNGAL